MSGISYFRRKEEGKVRHGLWIISSIAGVFFHGDRDEIQTSRYTESQLRSGFPLFDVEEITQMELISGLGDWHEAKYVVSRIVFQESFIDAEAAVKEMMQ